MRTHADTHGAPPGWLSLRRGSGGGVEGPFSAAPPLLYFSNHPLRLAAPLPLCCTLASARWIFLAVPILLPPVRAVLEPAKWLSFKPRAAGRVVAKPCCPPRSPPLLQQQLGLQVILSPAVSGAAPSLPHYAPTSRLQPPPALPSSQSLMARLQRGAQAGAFRAAPCLPCTHSPDSQSPPLPPLLMGFPNLLLPRTFPRTPDRRTEAWIRGMKEPGHVQHSSLSP